MTRIINIAGHSGSGKSVIALNLAIALLNKGRDVILVDGNIYSPDIMHYSDSIPSSFLNEYLDGHKKIDEIIEYHPSGLKIIYSLAEDKHDEKRLEKIDKGVLSLIGKAEIVIVDSFSHSPAMHSTIHNSDDTFFVVNDDLVSISKSREFINRIENKGIIVTGIIMNKKRKESRKENIEAIMGKNILTELIHDKKIVESINKRMPFVIAQPKSKAAKSINELAEMIDIPR